MNGKNKFKKVEKIVEKEKLRKSFTHKNADVNKKTQ